MAKAQSSYYPPRAHWYAPLFYFGAALRRRLSLDHTRLPTGVSIHHFLGGVLVPGLAVYLRGPRLWGQAAMGVCALLAGAFMIWLGCPAGNFAFGMLLSVHGTGLTYMCGPWLNGAHLGSRMLFSLGVLVVLGTLLYMPARNLIQDRWFVPLRVEGNLLIVHKHISAGTVHRGDWIAYSVRAQHGDNVYAQAGLGLGPVLAVGGDRIVFNERTFEVNGVSRPHRPHMPTSGEWILPEKHWFIWPEVDIMGHGVAEAEISGAIQRMATISQDQFVGKPFKRWFWRRQTAS